MSRTLISKYMSVDDLIPTLQKGDIIEFLDAEIYNKLVEFCLSPDELETDMLSTCTNERGVYLGELDGDYQAVHGDGSRQLGKSTLSDAAAGRKCRLNNGFDLFFPPSAGDEIAEKAISICKNRIRFNYVDVGDSMKCPSLLRYGIELTSEKRIDYMRLVRIYLYEEDISSHDIVDENNETIRKLIKREQKRDTVEFAFKAKWLTAEVLAKELRIGDLVEFKGNLAYAHWGVYIGRAFGCHMIVHKTQIVAEGALALGSAKSATSHTGGEIRQDPLSFVASGGLCRVNNTYDPSKKKPLHPLEIVENALLELKAQSSNEYNLIRKNCEHFAVSCRYGVAENTSNQIHDVIHTGILAVGVCGAVGVCSPMIGLLSFYGLAAHITFILVRGHPPPNTFGQRSFMEWWTARSL